MFRIDNNHLNPYDLHKRLINEYILIRPGDTKHLERDRSLDRTDSDVLRENHRFLWDTDAAETWEQQLAKRYYDKLFKEYCIADLSRYKENKIALRWRVEKEVVIGKGQFICGNKVCSEKLELRSWEVNFAYAEDGRRKNALIKVRLCPPCSNKLNFHSKKREVKRFKKHERKSRHKLKSPKCKVEIDEGDNNEASTSTAKESNSVETESSVDLNGQSDEKIVDRQQKPQKQMETECWTKPNTDIEEKSREEEFDAYLEDLLL